MNKKRIVLFWVVIFSPFINVVLPATIKEYLMVNFFNMPLFLPDIILYSFFIFYIISIEKKMHQIIFWNIVGICVIVVSNLIFSKDFIVQTILNLNFYITGIIFISLKITPTELNKTKYLFLFIFFFLCLQIFLFSFGLLVRDTGNTSIYGEYIRRGTTAGPSTLTGHLLLILTGILLFFFDSWKFRIFLLVTSFIAIFLTGTRGAILGFLFSLGCFVVFKVELRKKIYFAIITIILFVSINHYFNLLETISARNELILNHSDITSGRMIRYIKGFNAVFDNISNFAFGYGGAVTPYFNPNYTKLKPIYSPHNVYLSFLIENGIFGFTIFIIIITKMIVKVIPHFKLESFIFFSVILFTFNTEIIVREIAFSSFFWIFYLTLYCRNIEVIHDLYLYIKKQFAWNKQDNTLFKKRIGT